MQTRQMPAGDRIIPMTESDLSRVHQLECSSQQEPWSLQHFSDELNNPVASVALYMCGDKLAGFLCTWLIAAEMQIQNIAVVPEMRRKGIAVRLLEHAIESGDRKSTRMKSSHFHNTHMSSSS